MMFGSINDAKWSFLATFLLVVAGAAFLGWARQPRELRTDPPVVADLDCFRLMPNAISGAPPESYFAEGKIYESDAYNLSQGQRLYTWFGCQSCHGDGRGNVGPSFLDGWWLYGPEMVSIVTSIRDGRPHGMPAFRERMTIEQIWQLAGYVQTIGAYSAKVAATGRRDDRHTRPAENRAPAKILFNEGPVGAHPPGALPLRTARILLLSIIAAVAGCSGNQSALDPQGAPAIHVEHLIIGITVICAVVWLLVMIVLGWARLRKRPSDSSRPGEWSSTMIVGSAVAATVIIIAGLTIASFYTTRGIGLPENAALTITVRGHQWWWQVIYADANPALSFQTANEIHIPVGQDVRIQLESADVVHSFWVPSLAGKQDLVPGRSNVLLLRAERPGIYRGQCAEFCGLQHTHMAMMVIADEPVDISGGLRSNARTA